MRETESLSMTALSLVLISPDEQRCRVAAKAFAGPQANIALQLSRYPQLDDLASALQEAKSGPSSVRSEIASLEEQRAAAEKRRVGADNAEAVTDTVNFFGKVVTGHSVVNTGSFFASQQEKDEEVARLQARIDADQQRVSQPQGDLEEAQRRYDEFVAHVPW